MGQKMSDIFFQYQDFSKSRYPGFFSKHVFCPSPNWLIFHFFPVPRFFKKSLATRKSRYWKKWKNSFLPVIKNLLWVASLLVPGTGRKNVKNRFLPVSLVALLGRFYYLGSFLRKPIGDSGTGFFWNPVPEIISKLIFCPSPQSGFFEGRAVSSITMARPARWPLYGQANRLRWPAHPASEGCTGPLFPSPFVPITLMFPLPLCSHFYSSSQHETTHFYLLFFLLNSVPEISDFVSIDFVFSP